MKPKQSIWLLFSLVVLFLAFPISLQAEASNSVRIEGVVRDLTSGTPSPPIGSVDIIINGWLVVHSGRDGEWNITGLRPGEYTVELGLPRDSYTPAQDVITVGLWTPGAIERVDLNFYQGAAPAGMFAASDNVVPPLSTIAEQPIPPTDNALVAPPLPFSSQAQTEAATTAEVKATDQGTGLTPELGSPSDQGQTDETALQATMDQQAGETENSSTGKEIPGLGGAGPERIRYGQSHAFGQIVGTIVILLGLFFIISGIRSEGSRNVG